MFIAILTYKKPLEEVDRYLQAHRDYLSEHYAAGNYDGNVKSKRVCEKSGFRYHHTNKDITSPLGDKRTEHFYIMTKEDFHALYID